ncbi:MAG: hypothetical protein PGN22_05115 [Agrobacterium cavarae]
MPTFEITGADGRKHLVEAESQPKALAQFHSFPQSAPQQNSANWWEAAPLVDQPSSNSWQDAPVMKSDRQAAQMPAQPDRMKQLETALINADKVGDTEAAKILASEIQKGRSAQASPDMDRIKRNVSKMAGMNAPVEDIDGYIASEGVTLDAVRNHKPSSVSFDDLIPGQKPSSVSFDDLVPNSDNRQAAGPWTKYQGKPIEVQGPDGAIIQFPAGTPEDVMQSAMRKHYGFTQPVTDEMRQGAHKELLRRGAMAEIERRKQATSHPSFEESQSLLNGDSGTGPWTKYPQPGKNREIIIEGRTVEVSPDFFNLSREQQDATVDEIAAELRKAGGNQKQRYQAEVNGERYEIEAPNEQAAHEAARKLGGQIQGNDSQQKRMQGASGAVGASLTGFADGIPVVGPALLGAGQRGAAIASTIINGGTYDENLKAAQGITQQAQAAHPWITTGANVAGTVAGTVPLMAAAPAAFGVGGGGMAAKTAASGLSGMVLGTADAGVRSEGDLGKMALGGGFGLASGLVGPFAGKLIGLGAQKFANAITNRSAAAAAGTTPRTVRGLADLAARDGLDAQGVRSALDNLGPDSMLMDIGPGLQGRAGGIAASPGRGQAIIRDALTERQAGANARLSQAVDENLGPNVVPSQIEAGIRENQRALGAFYDEAFQGAKAVNTRPIADALDSQAVNLRGDAQSAVMRVRGMLDINGAPGNLDPNPGTLFQTRQAIDGMMAAETNPQVVRALTTARQQIDDELARSVPNLKAVDANYAELARQREALARGQTVLDSKRGSPRPSELADEVFQGAQPQGLQVGPSAVPFRMSQGARAEVDRILGNNANDITALNKLIKTEGDWNRSRLATLFGQDKADRLFKVLESEKVYADTASTVTRNSETARRILAAGESRAAEPDLVRQAAAVGGVTAVPRAVAIKAGDKILAALLSGRKEALETEVSKALSTKNRAIVEALRVRQSLPTSDPRIEAITRALMTGTSFLPAR